MNQVDLAKKELAEAEKYGDDDPRTDQAIARAQVHATLAVAFVLEEIHQCLGAMADR